MIVVELSQLECSDNKCYRKRYCHQPADAVELDPKRDWLSSDGPIIYIMCQRHERDKNWCHFEIRSLVKCHSDKGTWDRQERVSTWQCGQNLSKIRCRNDGCVLYRFHRVHSFFSDFIYYAKLLQFRTLFGLFPIVRHLKSNWQQAQCNLYKFNFSYDGRSSISIMPYLYSKVTRF